MGMTQPSHDGVDSLDECDVTIPGCGVDYHQNLNAFFHGQCATFPPNFVNTGNCKQTK